MSKRTLKDCIGERLLDVIEEAREGECDPDAIVLQLESGAFRMRIVDTPEPDNPNSLLVIEETYKGEPWKEH